MSTSRPRGRTASAPTGGTGSAGRRTWPGVWSVFFFQAEDGIRDLTVTGVQTCALPICWLPSREGPWRDDADGTALLRVALLTVPCYLAVIWLSLTFLDAGVAVGPRYYIDRKSVV